MPDEKVDLSEWFDVRDNKHLVAMDNYIKLGSWPKFFIPADVVITEESIERIKNKIVTTYIVDQTTYVRSLSSLPVAPEYGQYGDRGTERRR